MTNYRVLIADDEPLILLSLKGCLDWDKMGYTIVDTCGNGISALARARELRPDIVLADIRMPGMSGLELMRTIGGEMPYTQGIFMSGYAEFSYVREAIRQDARAYLLKPINTGELIEALNKARGRLDQSSARLDVRREVYSLKLQAAIEYIDAHVKESISLNDVAGALYISPTYLCQLFRREMDTTFTQYLTEKKMSIACKLLKQPDATIEGVASELGYCDYFYFHRVFKKVVGTPPGSYRARGQADINGAH